MPVQRQVDRTVSAALLDYKPMKKVLLGVCGAFVACGVGVYVTMLMPPNLDDVCENILKVSGGDPGNGVQMNMCRDGLEQGSMEGQIPYVKRLKCARDASDKSALKDC